MAGSDDLWVSRGNAMGKLYDRMGLGTILSIAAFVFLALDVRGALAAIAKTQMDMQQMQADHNKTVERLAVSIEVGQRISQSELKSQTKLALINCVSLAQNNDVRKQCIEAVSEK